MWLWSAPRRAHRDARQRLTARVSEQARAGPQTGGELPRNPGLDRRAGIEGLQNPEIEGPLFDEDFPAVLLGKDSRASTAVIAEASVLPGWSGTSEIKPTGRGAAITSTTSG